MPLLGGFVDVKSESMAGVGVSFESPLAASFLNPALLAASKDGSDRSTNLLLPSLSVGAVVDQDMMDAIDDFQDNERWDQLNTAIDRFNALNASSTEAEARAALEDVIENAGLVNQSLTALDRKGLQAQVDIGAAMSRSGGGHHGYGVFVSGQADIAAIARYNDAATVDRVIDEAQRVLDAADASDPSGLSEDLLRPEDDPSSNASVIAVAIAEVGISYARSIAFNGWRMQLGVSPKFQQIRTFDYTANAESFDENDFDAGDAETEDTLLNVDLGAAFQVQSMPGASFGLVARNLVSHEIETASGATYKLSPLVKAGVSYSAASYVVAMDLDLTETTGAGFEGSTQLLNVGGEYSPFDWLHLRAGASKNLAHGDGESPSIDDDQSYSLGLGFSPGAGRIDFGAVMAENTSKFGVQFGYLF